MKYWEKRLLKSQENLLDKTIEETRAQLKKYYQDTMLRVIDEFEATHDKLLAAIEAGKKPTPADLYTLDRYWKLQAQLKAELQKLGDKQAEFLSEQFEDEYMEFYKTMAVESEDTYATASTSNAQQAVNQIWCADGKSWSKRIWDNTNKLQQMLNDELIDCVVSGKSTLELKKNLTERFNVSFSAADSLVRTEMAHIATQSALDRYKALGIKNVMVWATKDERRCDVCGKLHEKIFDINGHVPIPAHPRCRCAIRPVFNNESEEIKMETKTYKRKCQRCGKLHDSTKRTGVAFCSKECEQQFIKDWKWKQAHVTARCTVCNELFVKSKKATSQVMCPDCYAEYRKKYKAQKEKERRAKKKNNG